MTTIGLLLFAFEVLSANNVSYFSKNDFKITSSLNGRFWEEELDLYDPSDMFYKDDKLIVFDEANPNHMISVIDIREHDITLELGEEGGGPKELISTASYDPGFQDKSFWVFDISTNRFNEFSFDSEDKMAVNYKKIKQPMISPLWINEQRVIDAGLYNGDYLFEVTDLKSGSVEGFGSWNQIVKTGDARRFRNFMQGYLYANQDRSLVAHLGLKSKLIAILDLESKKTKTLIGPVADSDSPDWFRSPYIRTFQMGFVGENEIYALYSGKEVVPGRTFEAAECTEIYTFSFDGTPSKRLLLNESIQTFTVDEERGIIYGINFQSEPPRIVEFSY